MNKMIKNTNYGRKFVYYTKCRQIYKFIIFKINAIKYVYFFKH